MMSRRKPRDVTLLGDLLPGTAEVPAASDVEINGIAADSRVIKAGDLFVAYDNAGTSRHLAEAAARGAAAALLEAERAPEAPAYGMPVLPLPRLRAQAGWIAARFFQHPSRAMRVIGVTGTNGKTTVTQLIAEALALRGHRSGVSGTLGCGVPGKLTPSPNTTLEAVALQTMLAGMRDRKIETLAMEVSSHGLEEQRIAGVEFALAMLTNLGRDHLDYHQTMARYRQAKRRLFSDHGVRRGVFNLDDDFGRELADEFQARMDVLGYTLLPSPPRDFLTLAGTLVDSGVAGMRIVIELEGRRGELTTPLIGRFNAGNLLAALAALCSLDVPFDDAVEALSRCRGVPGRMEVIRRGDAPTVVIDYAHTPDALEQALTALRPLTAGKLWCVFGCGGDRDRGKRAPMGELAEKFADRVIVTDDNPRHEPAHAIIDEISGGVKDRGCLRVIADRRDAVQAAITEAAAGDVVLIAGKGHEDYQELDGRRVPLSDRLLAQRALGHIDRGAGT